MRHIIDVRNGGVRMKIIPFSEIKNELISNMQRGLLIPIIGSGFTRNCSSFRGKVPSGNDYRRYMIGRILEAEPSLSVEKERLEKETFSNISSMYHKVVPNEAQEQYLRNNFTRVAIEDKKKDLLSLPWPYIYTLNIDDGIEKNSDYCRVIYANRQVNDRILIVKNASLNCTVMFTICFLIRTLTVKYSHKNSILRA